MVRYLDYFILKHMEEVQAVAAVATSVNIDVVKTITVAAMMAMGTLVPAFAIGWIGTTALKAIGRNPEAGSKIQTPMILAIAFAEAIAVYSLVVALIIKFV
ncbi:MAG: F-type H+-transporting ATPase subunit c [Patescibacteria group bacterium]|jgi:F-type H+-transporting ATPase subunit c|nr:F-type H+-transporting ATPase subunit c [Patescibacteria group bacterium]